MDRNISKNISKNVSSKSSQKILDHAKQSARYALKTTSNRRIQKTAETTGDLQEAQTLHHRIIQKQIQKKCLEKKISREVRQKINDDLRLQW